MSKRILVAPLNWGLGHATRCIPIIKALLTHNYTPVIASDGSALELLKKEFPTLEFAELPSYDIKYSKKGKYFKLKLISHLPKLKAIVKAEKKATKQLIKSLDIDGIISDNRLGVYSKKIPSAIITHQLQVFSGDTTWLTTKIHQYFIEKFDACWVPDWENKTRLSGELSTNKDIDIPVKHLGPLSRFKPLDVKPIYDILILLSGPEPQRSILEAKLLSLFSKYDGKVIMVRGLIGKEQHIHKHGSITVYNYMISEMLELAINASQIIISRSGYTTIMDLAKLNKKAFFIPTPGQYEQKYLAKYLKSVQVTPYAKQKAFELKNLDELHSYSGFVGLDNFETDFKTLFSEFFQSERKLTTNV